MISTGPSTHRQVFGIDVVMIACTLMIAVIGVVMVYTASRGSLIANGDSPTYYLKRQALFVVIGVVVMLAVALMDYRHYEPVAMGIYVLSVLSLVGVFVVGSHAQGSERWFNLGPLQLQPSEFAVLAEVLAIATYCSRRNEGLAWRDVIRVLIMAGIPIVLVMAQPDLGTAIIMTIVLFVMLAAAGLPIRILVILAVAAVLTLVVALEAGLLHHYQIARISSFLHQDVKVAQGVASPVYNLNQSKAAIGSGGLWGSGLFHGAQTNLGYVPEQQTDFIFSAVGEQLGFFGASAVLGLLGLIAWRFLRTAQLARDSFGRLLCAGLFAFVAFSVFQNAGMAMGIMPITGIPLPFVSYGGTAVLAFFAAVGVSLSVYSKRGA